MKSRGEPILLKQYVKRIFGDLIPQDHIYGGLAGEPVKPEPNAYTYILKNHGIHYTNPDQIIMVGDIVQYDLRPAMDNGMTALWITRMDCLTRL